MADNANASARTLNLAARAGVRYVDAQEGLISTLALDQAGLAVSFST